MIGIKIDNEYLDMKPDAAIELQINSPFFADDIIPGTYSIPFTVPRSERNERILQKPLAQYTGSRKYNSQLYINFINWLDGQLNLRNIGTYTYSMNLQSALANLGESFRDQKIRDLLDEEIVIDSANHPKIISLQPPVGYDAGDGVSLMVNGQTFQNTNMVTMANDINELENVDVTFYHSGWPGPGGTVGGLYFTLQNSETPNDPLADLYIDRQGWQWQILENDWRTNYFDAMTTYLNQFIAATPPHPGIRFPQFRNDKPVSENLTGAVAFTNYQKDSVFFRTGVNVTTPINSNGIAPCVLLSYIFDKIKTKFGLQFKGDFFDNPDLQSLLFIPRVTMSVPKPYLREDRDFVFWRRSFNIKDFVPDITVGDLLKNLQKLFCLHIGYDNRYNIINVNLRNDAVTANSYVDRTRRSSKLSNVEVPDGLGYTLRSRPVQDDSYRPANSDLNPQAEIIVGDGNTTFESAFMGMAEEDITAGVVSFYGVRFSQEWEELGGNFEPRLAFYRGINERTAGNQYAEARQQTHRYSLAWPGEKGLYKVFWQSYLRMLQLGYTAETDMILYVKDLVDFNFEEKQRIDGRDYMIRAITLRANMYSLKASKVTLQLVP